MNDDMELEGELRRAAELFDPVPPHLLQVASEAYRFRTIDAELADLTFDSLAGPVPVRGGEHPRLLTFGAAGSALDLEISETGTTNRIVGQVMPPREAAIEVRGPGPVSLTTDSLGRFTVDRVPAGPFSIRCRTGDVAFTTEWVTI
ncbi:hypothetical protein N5079_29700 [Planotetraspora sp. A-T 1434]|uniref:hypothetical protein n=1 Tax=Planotetraspora sp. A-T 1434 TaxID=2979219 RepID=UPI0021BE4FE4|nr:hypothetical protein [Planotetraspora sp. A-T 1434]MCT9934387.1 hypothetical protein [Planotetraspora sp. A-T 1434]